MVRLMYQFQAATCFSMLEALVQVGCVVLSYCNVESPVPRGNQIPSKEGLVPAAIKAWMALMVRLLLCIPR